MDVVGLVSDLGDRAREELDTPVDIEDIDSIPDENEVYSEKRTWLRIKDVVAVAADMKSSTQLNFNRYAPTSASLYEATMGNCVRIADSFEADFVDVQGDGLFALYHGERAYERGLCAAITLKSFSHEQLVPAIEDLDGDVPKTGLKLGIDAGILAVKKVGMRGTNEPVWAGRPVNWAFKCAQSADSNELIVTGRIWDKFKSNDYVTYSCDCGDPRALWDPAIVEVLPADERECHALRRTPGWCEIHGNEYCQKILEGKKARMSVMSKRISDIAKSA